MTHPHIATLFSAITKETYSNSRLLIRGLSPHYPHTFFKWRGYWQTVLGAQPNNLKYWSYSFMKAFVKSIHSSWIVQADFAQPQYLFQGLQIN